MSYIGFNPVQGSAHLVDEFTSSGGSTYTLSSQPANKNVVEVVVGGLTQSSSTYSLSGTTLTLAGVASGTKIIVRQYAEKLLIPTPGDDTVTGAKIVDNALDSEHYTDGSIDTAHLSADCVDGTKIADDAINSEHYAAASIDAEHLAVGKDGAFSFDATPNTDHTANGPQTSTMSAGYTTTIMDLVYLGSGNEWLEADADATGTSINLLGIALEVKNDGQPMNVALPGSFVRDDSWNWTGGVPLYISNTPGAITATKPTGSGDVVRTVGYAVTGDVIFFNPSSDYVTLA